MSDTSLKTVVIIGGPTASGKSGLALSVALAVGGCVINADSMQIYNGLPMLAAQPSAEEKQQAPHRLYGALAPNDICSAALWRKLALQEIERAAAENLVPVIVGGTGLYLKALLQGLSPVPECDPAVRERLIALHKEIGTEALFQEFKHCDPVMAAKLDAHNPQRIIRAWEVLETTGKSLAEWQSVPPVPPPAYLRFVTVTLIPEREVLYQRCNDRFVQMMDHGVLDEVAEFQSRIQAGEVAADAPLHHALGFQELCAYLEGETNKEMAIQRAQQSTRNYAKRQTTWFRNQLHPDVALTQPDTEAVLSCL